MTKALTNYDKIKISTAHVFLQYDQATMIHKYSLDYNSDWLYSKTSAVQNFYFIIISQSFRHIPLQEYFCCSYFRID